MKATNKILPTLSMLVYVFLWAPVILLVIFSFSKNKLGIKWEGFTLQWYLDIIDRAAMRDALIRSLVIASITIVVATIAGTMIAYGLYKYKFRGRGTLRITMLLPMVMPSIVTGGALLLFFTRAIHIPLGYLTIIIAHITFSTPLAMFVVLGRMTRIDWALEEASADLGADTLTTWRKITIPLLLPAIIASAALIFPWSFNDFVITYFVTGVGVTTLPIYIFSMLRFSQTSVVNSIGTIFVVLPIIGTLLMSFLRRKEIT